MTHTKDEALIARLREEATHDLHHETIALLLEAAQALAAPVQPVAWRFTGIAGFKRFVTDAKYKAFLPEVRAWYEPFKCSSCTTPPAAQRQWVGLTDEEIFSVLGNLQRKYNGPPTEDSRVVFALAIEAKLKEKNT
jgi:hypothetical protein